MVTYCKKLTYGQCNVINLYISKCTSNIVNKPTTTTSTPALFNKKCHSLLPGDMWVFGKCTYSGQIGGKIKLPP